MEKHTIDGRTVEAKKAVPRDDLVWISENALSTSCVKLFSIDCEQAPAADDDDGDETEEEKKLQRGVRLLRRTPRSPKRKTGSSWLRYQEAHDHQLYTKLEGQKLRTF
uniref:Uncharacterized protein n=1 Tax=Brassica oleracea var. oleracea TaxID=109376 RepID=A0A0D3E1X3_BRAOL